MKLRFIDIKELFGTFSRRVDFNEKLNLLVGINGSGKTTVLSCIDWVLRPDFAELACVRFQYIHLGISHENRNYVIKVEQSKGALIISRDGGNKVHPIRINLYHHFHGFDSDASVDNLRGMYRGMHPEDHEVELWNFLNNLPHPLTITLDRSISAEIDDAAFFESGAARKIKKNRKASSPLEKVSEVTREGYSSYRKLIFGLNEELKNKLVISAFKNPFGGSGNVDKRRISLAEISKLEKKVSQLLSASLGGEEAATKIAEYFSDARRLAKLSADDERLRPVFWVQFQQIAELTKAFDTYERRASQAYESVGSYLRALNSFFTESAKRVDFNEANGTLSFRFLNREGEAVGEFLPISRLSSGEKQIIILLTFLAFVSSPNQVFVVDEPELSLHPRWQENFLDAVISQAPPNTQIILATHSPEIVAHHRSSCIVLKV